MGRVGLAVPSRSHKHRQAEFDPQIDAHKIVLTLTLTLTLTVLQALAEATEEHDLVQALKAEARMKVRSRVVSRSCQTPRVMGTTPSPSPVALG